MQANSQSVENTPNSVLDIGMTSIQYCLPMKTRKQPNVFPLRFTSKAQRDTIKRAAQREGRSMNNYILRTMLAKAAADLQSQAETAITNLG